MAWTRTTYLSQLREEIDAVGSNRWSDASLKRYLGLAHQRLWKQILDANMAYRFAERTVTPDANGKVALSSLNGGTGDTLERFYRIVSDENGYGGVRRGVISYQEAKLTRFPSYRDDTSLTGAYSGVYWIEGDYLQVLPRTGGDVTVRVSHTPARIDELSADSSEAAFPDGYELAVCYEAASLALAKGGAETEAGTALKIIGKDIMDDLISTIARRSTAPLRISASDNASDWGR